MTAPITIATPMPNRRVRVLSSRPLSRPPSWLALATTRATPAVRLSRSGGTASRPPYATASNVRANSSNDSEPSARRTSLVVNDGRYRMAPRSAETQQARRGSAAGARGRGDRRVRRRRRIVRTRRDPPTPRRGSRLGRRRRLGTTSPSAHSDHHERDRRHDAASASTRSSARGTQHASEPVDDAVQPIAEPVQWLAERSRGRRATRYWRPDTMCCAAFRACVRIDGCGDPAQRDAHCAIAICTSNASSRMRRSK